MSELIHSTLVIKAISQKKAHFALLGVGKRVTRYLFIEQLYEYLQINMQM